MKIHLAKSNLLKVVVHKLKMLKSRRLRSLKVKKLKSLKVEKSKSLKVVAKAFEESNVQKYNMKNEDRNIMGKVKTKTWGEEWKSKQKNHKPQCTQLTKKNITYLKLEILETWNCFKEH